MEIFHPNWTKQIEEKKHAGIDLEKKMQNDLINLFRQKEWWESSFSKKNHFKKNMLKLIKSSEFFEIIFKIQFKIDSLQNLV